MEVTEADEEWRKQNELLRVVEVNEIEKFESPGVICREKDLNFVVQISSEKEQSPEEMQRSAHVNPRSRPLTFNVFPSQIN